MTKTQRQTTTKHPSLAFDLDGCLYGLRSDQETLRLYKQHRNVLVSGGQVGGMTLEGCDRMIECLTAAITNKKKLIELRTAEQAHGGHQPFNIVS